MQKKTKLKFQSIIIFYNKKKTQLWKMLQQTYLQFYQPEYIAISVILIIREVYLQVYRKIVFIVPD